MQRGAGGWGVGERGLRRPSNSLCSALNVIVNSLRDSPATTILLAKAFQSKIEKVLYWKYQTESTKKSLVSTGLSQHLFSVLSKRETREHTFKTF